MAFVKFTKTRSRIGSPRAAIWSRGQIGFNQGAVEEYKLNKFKYLMIYYDEEAKKIGIEFTNENNAEGAIKLIIRKGSGISFSALSFLKSYKIDYSETKQYDLIYDENNNLYVFDLNNPKK